MFLLEFMRYVPKETEDERWFLRPRNFYLVILRQLNLEKVETPITSIDKLLKNQLQSDFLQMTFKSSLSHFYRILKMEGRLLKV